MTDAEVIAQAKLSRVSGVLTEEQFDRLVILAEQGVAVQWRPIGKAGTDAVVLARDQFGGMFFAVYYAGAKLWLAGAMSDKSRAAVEFISLSALAELETTP